MPIAISKTHLSSNEVDKLANNLLNEEKHGKHVLSTNKAIKQENLKPPEAKYSLDEIAIAVSLVFFGIFDLFIKPFGFSFLGIMFSALCFITLVFCINSWHKSHQIILEHYKQIELALDSQAEYLGSTRQYSNAYYSNKDTALVSGIQDEKLRQKILDDLIFCDLIGQDDKAITLLSHYSHLRALFMHLEYSNQSKNELKKFDSKIKEEIIEPYLENRFLK